MYQIKKFLRHNDVEWANGIRLPPDPDYTPKRLTSDDISATLEYFKDDIYYERNRAIILLGYTSGLRAEELYKLTPNDIDLDNRIVHIRHDPQNNHSTKTRKSRVSFFTSKVKDALNDYFCNHDIKLRLASAGPSANVDIWHKIHVVFWVGGAHAPLAEHHVIISIPR